MENFLKCDLEALRETFRGMKLIVKDDAPPCPFHRSSADVILWDFTPDTEWACLKCSQIFSEEDPHGS